jgi:uncharacterized protein involved in exopolysaccharide biosynthesis
MKSYQRQLPHLPDTEALPALPVPEHEPSSGLSILQIATIARHYWKQSVVIALLLVVVFSIFIKLMPKSYTATATLIVNSTHDSPLPNQQSGNDLADYVATQAELIQSPAVLMPVIERLNLTKAEGFTGAAANSAVARDVAERSLASSVQVLEGRGGQLLEIQVSTGNPARSALIANTIANVYLQQDRARANNPVNRQAQLSSQELEQLRQKVVEAQARVTAFRDQNGLTDLSLTPGANDTENQALVQLQGRLLQAQNQIRALEAQQAGQIANGDEALASARVTGLRQELATLQEKLANLRPTLGPRHPEIVGLQAQIRATRAELNGALGNLSSNISTQLSRARELEKELTQAVAAQRDKVMKLRQVQDQGAKLALELQSAQAVYKQALDNIDQVKFDTIQNFANVDLVSYATAPVRPTKPNKVQLFFMACIAAAGLGVLMPLGYELWVDRRVRCKDDLERGLGVRVLAHLNSLPAPGAV